MLKQRSIWSFTFSLVLFGTMFSLPATTAADSRPNFEMPFPCKQTWNSNTRSNHNPKWAIDFQHSDAYGKKVVASYSGKVVTVKDLGNQSYGKFIKIQHGNSGWSTLYAHLSKISVKKNQQVKQGQTIGYVGSTGNSTGPHLHYEQIYKGNPQKAYLHGQKVYYWGDRKYTSHNQCN